jgi:hypothetical protein
MYYGILYQTAISFILLASLWKVTNDRSNSDRRARELTEELIRSERKRIEMQYELDKLRKTSGKIN